uniref:SH3 domain-containing protein n=1 Tax=Parerythrobacter lutipelagi TaxID=1964208 RepID=UPI001F0303BE|nr:SH3 domain-containing protein [Parerythrobacter lutipelagi]
MVLLAATAAFGIASAAASAHKVEGTRAVPPTSFEACNGIYLYSADKDPAGLNIRSGPGTQYKVLGRTNWQHLKMTEFKVLGSQDGWFKVLPNAEWNYRTQKLEPLAGYAGEGWVSAKMLEMTYYEGDEFDLHAVPGSKDKQHFIRELEVSGPQKLASCKGRWVQIEHSEWTLADDPEDEVETVYAGWILGFCASGKPCPFLPTGGVGKGGARNLSEGRSLNN